MKFSPGEAIKFGWETFKKRPWFFIGATLVIAIAYIVVGSISTGIDSMFGGGLEEETIPGMAFNYLVGALIGMGVTAFFLAAHDSPETVELGALWHPSPYWKYVGTSLLFAIVITIGFILLIVPGLIALVFFMFSTFLVIDRGLGPIEAMKESMRITEGNRWPLFGFVLLLALITILGALALGVGLLVAWPVATLAFAHAYRLLSGAAEQPALQDARLNT